jgi:hypothetical protein
MTIVTYEEFAKDAASMFEGAVESAYKDLLEKAVAEAVAAEREACAKVCDATNLIDMPITVEVAAMRKCASAIRARSKT